MISIFLLLWEGKQIKNYDSQVSQINLLCKFLKSTRLKSQQIKNHDSCSESNHFTLLAESTN